MTIANLHQKKLFPYSPKALIKAMEKMEFCDEAENATVASETNQWSTVRGTFDFANNIDFTNNNNNNSLQLDRPTLEQQKSSNQKSKKKKSRKQQRKLKKQLSTQWAERISMTNGTGENSLDVQISLLSPTGGDGDDDAKISMAIETTDEKGDGDKKPKKLVINSLFLQDVKYARQQQEQQDEIAKKREQIQETSNLCANNIDVIHNFLL